MKKTISILLLALAAWFPAHAENAAWVKAQAEAKAGNKLVLLDFTGSDWCPNCIFFHREVQESPEFLAYAKTNLVTVVVDFPKHYPQSLEQSDANSELLMRFKVPDAQGNVAFPALLLVDAEGKEITRWIGYRPGSGAADFIAKIEQAKKK